MTPSQRLLARLRDECGLDLPDGAQIQRTYVKRHQRDAGAMVWTVHRADGMYLQPLIGSQWPVTELLKHRVIEVAEPDRFGDRHVDPDLSSPVT